MNPPEHDVATTTVTPEDIVRSFALAFPPSSTVALAVKASIPHADVADDRELLRRALLALHGTERRGTPMWSTVHGALGHGSGVSTAICRALGLDPDATPPKRRRSSP